MGDQDSDFKTPEERREARTFEPPPWERDQYERFARERAEQEAAVAAARSAVEMAAAEGSAALGVAAVVAPVNPASAFEAEEARVASSPFA